MTVALRLIASLLVLGGVLWLVQPQAALDAIARPHAGWLALSVAALVAQIGLSALRWQVTARALGQPLPRLWVIQEYALSIAGNTFLPGGVLGDLGRIFRSRAMGWQGDGWRGAAASVVVERLAGQVAMIGLMLLALTAWLGIEGVVLALAVGTGCVLFLGFVPKLRRLLVRAWLPYWPVQIGLTLAILLVNLLGFWAAAQAVGLALGLQAAVVVIPVTLLAMVVPLSLNGWGLREGVAAALWPLWGISAPQAVAASILFGLACMAAAILGLLTLVPRLFARARPENRH